MSSAVLVQTNGFGSLFQLLIHSRTSFSRAMTLWWTPRRMSWSVSSPNQRSTWLIQDDPVGVKCRWKAGVAGQPVADRRGLVGGQVVADQVHVQLGRDGLVDGDEELAELDCPVLAVQRGDDVAVGDVEGGEQAGSWCRGGRSCGWRARACPASSVAPAGRGRGPACRTSRPRTTRPRPRAGGGRARRRRRPCPRTAGRWRA